MEQLSDEGDAGVVFAWDARGLRDSPNVGDEVCADSFAHGAHGLADGRAVVRVAQQQLGKFAALNEEVQHRLEVLNGAGGAREHGFVGAAAVVRDEGAHFAGDFLRGGAEALVHVREVHVKARLREAGALRHAHGGHGLDTALLEQFQWAGTGHASLSEWRAAANFDAAKLTDITVDPRIALPEEAPAYAGDFERMKRPDFRPAPASPLRGAIRISAEAGPNDFSGAPLPPACGAL